MFFKSNPVIGLVLLFVSTHIFAQTPPNQPIDEDLIGTWTGEFKATKEASCTPYKWRMERKHDGTYHFYAFDDTQTILEENGHWWVDQQHEHYFETTVGQTEEPSTYTYSLSQSNLNDATASLEFTQIKPLAADECSQTLNFNEQKTSS